MKLRALLLQALAIATTATAAPQLQWLQTSHDFGAFSEELETVGCSFRFVNSGDEPLVITNARASCGCTTPQYPHTAIAPGDTAAIDVKFNAIDRPGRFKKQVYVYTNTVPDRYTLTISGTVIGTTASVQSRYPVDAGRLKLRNATVAFGEVTVGKVSSQFFEAYNQSADTIRPVWTNVPDYIQIVTVPEEVPPGEQMVSTMSLIASKAPEWGFNFAHLKLLPDKDNESQGTTVETIALISEDFSNMTDEQRRRSPMVRVSPISIDLGIIESNKTVNASIYVQNDGKDPLLIRRAYTLDKGLSVKADRPAVKHGNTATISIAIDPSAFSDNYINSRINIITNDPIAPLTTVRIIGEIKR
jgi:hypothetical protein